ncbi:MAG TPA: hypothetical protein VE441_07560 [Mycobacterium sp.]|nr:hypothetical protein [Mycobacterium sp.]
MLGRDEVDFVRQWGPKIGTDAARLKWSGTQLLGRGYFLNFAWIPSVIAGAKLAWPVLLSLGILLGLASAAHCVLAGLKFRDANRMASQELGLRLGFGHVAPPPREPDHYQAWCRRYGVTPYTAITPQADQLGEAGLG